jgi:hypothetical protein
VDRSRARRDSGTVHGDRRHDAASISGPARALLKVVAKNPKAVLDAQHG